MLFASIRRTYTHRNSANCISGFKFQGGKHCTNYIQAINVYHVIIYRPSSRKAHLAIDASCYRLRARVVADSRKRIRRSAAGRRGVPLAEHDTRLLVRARESERANSRERRPRLRRVEDPRCRDRRRWRRNRIGV